MKKKIICILIITLVVGAFIANHLITYAGVATTPLYVNLTPTDVNGLGYGIGNPDPKEGGTSNQGEYIWNINTYESIDGVTLTDPQRNLYCIKANYGASWESNANAKPENIVKYNLAYDLQTDKAKLEKIVGDTAGSVVKDLLDEDKYYNEILWILDNAYVSGETSYDDFMDKIGIGKTTDGLYYNKQTLDSYQTYKMTDEDIKAVQKVAIWYFTNKDDKTFDKTTATQWLNITVKDEETGETEYTSLTTSTGESKEGYNRNEQANILYNYLITEAAKYPDYVSSTIEPVRVEGTAQTDGTYKIETTRVGERYVIGPIVLKEGNSSEYKIESLQVLDQNQKPVEFKYREQQDGEDLVSIETIVGNEDGFYISLDRNSVTEIEIKVNIEYKTTNKTLWLSGEETISASGELTGITLNGEQPLVEVTKNTTTLPIIFKSKPEEFDLALRKYITAVRGADSEEGQKGEAKTILNPRNLNNISVDRELQDGTTASYKHRKDPVVVEEKDIVTYAIRIYNEGNKAGYASEIIDQLPRGLVLKSNNTVKSIGKDGNEKNAYIIGYSSSTNRITLSLDSQVEPQSLQPYTKETGLDYETIEIECKVAQEADMQNEIILTNIAWISKSIDSETGLIAIDRDSQTEIAPSEAQGNTAQDNMTNYRGTTTEAESALTNQEFYFKGQHDEDDFEKLVIKPIPKKFDLALVKFIGAVSADPIIEEGEYLTDTGNSDGEYLRAPDVLMNGTEIEYNFDKKGAKSPLAVEPGSYVLYVIRVYNEGELDGYASLIKDTLPKGLTLADVDIPAQDQSKPYYGIWSVVGGVDSEGRQTVTTDNFAEGNGADEITPGSNLLKAFDTEIGISNGNPDYLDALILCKVAEDQESGAVLTNYAQISEDTGDDIDSIPDNDVPGDDIQEDDEDIEKVVVERFDLSLRKFISSVNGVEPAISREPVIDTTPLKEKTGTDAIYKHSKIPLAVKVGDKVIYTIRVYNEGDINGYASEVKDYLPPYLKYDKDSELNANNGWVVNTENERIYSTTKLANKEITKFTGTNLDYEDLQMECIVVDEIPLNENQTNIAEISKYKYKESETIKDSDSLGNSMEELIPTDKELPDYKKDKENEPYVPGNEDDDDFEKIYVQRFDLALRKFITKVQENEVTTRVPQVDLTPLKNGEDTAIYTHPKDALIVHVGEVVVYTLRIYNEGEIDGFASEITDDIPEYLEYLPKDSTNVEYMWKMYDENGNETEKVEEAVKVKTTYLSKEKGEDNLIKAFDGETLSYKDVKIAFKVKDPNSNTYIITNHAQISNDTDANGKEIDDNDSITDKWNEGEDDQDIENVKVQYFDLSLLKFVSKVIVKEDGKETITETGYNGHEDPEPVVKVELHKKKLKDVVVKFGYGITITNEGDIAGYATEITDYVPEGLKFDPTDNPEWMDEGNNVISTRQLEDTLLQPGESKTVEVIFTWINSPDNLAQKTNTAEISEDKNEYDVPDRDSTPDNKVEGEDDIDIAKVILAVSTGRAKTYFTLTLGLLGVVFVGIALIKKFVI